MSNLVLLPPAPVRPAAAVARMYYRPSEVAEATGSPLGVVLRALSSGDLEGHRRGRGWYVAPAAIDRWITGSAVHA